MSEVAANIEIGRAVFMYMLGNMVVTPADDKIYLCSPLPDSEQMICGHVQKKTFCETGAMPEYMLRDEQF